MGLNPADPGWRRRFYEQRPMPSVYETEAAKKLAKLVPDNSLERAKFHSAEAKAFSSMLERLGADIGLSPEQCDLIERLAWHIHGEALENTRRALYDAKVKEVPIVRGV